MFVLIPLALYFLLCNFCRVIVTGHICLIGYESTTVDGRNPANQLIGRISHSLRGSFHPRWFSRRISEPSTLGGA